MRADHAESGPLAQVLSEFPSTTLALPDPQALGDDLPPVPTLDAELLPSVLRPWLLDAAERLQAPLEFLAVPAMVAAGAAIGRRCGIRPKRRDDWTVTANVWGAIVGRPSTMKSPAINAALAPLRRLEAEAATANDAADKDYYKALKAFQAGEKAAMDAAKAVAKKAAKEGSQLPDLSIFFNGNEPVQPAHRRFVTNDATYEKAGALMAVNPMGLLVVRDELVSFLRPLDREESAAARGFWLESWNGLGGYTFDRIGRGTVRVEAVCASIVGGVQPSRLACYVRDVVTGGAGDDGLLQRFGMLVWPDADLEWRDVDRSPNREAMNQAFAVFDRLVKVNAETTGAACGPYDAVPALGLDEDAAEAFGEWRANMERRTRSGELHPAMESHLTKYRKLVPALALSMHLMDTPEGGPVSIDSMRRAIAWAGYLEPHAARVYGAATMPERANARLIWDRLKRGALPARFTSRDIQRRGWTGLGDADSVKAALEVLCDHALIVGQLAETLEIGGRPTVRYSMNPKAVSM